MHTGKARFKCPVAGCEFATAWQSPFDTHMKAHTATTQYRCKEVGCFYICAREGSLVRHTKEEHPSEGSATFRCAVHDCRETFSTHEALARHVPLHREQQLHNCRQCGRSYLSETGFEKHKTKCSKGILNKRVRVRPYKCTMPSCGTSFTQTDHRDRHMLIHKGGPVVKGVSMGALSKKLVAVGNAVVDGDENEST
eukprot:comp75126_c0_seq1/m.48243 comp75126_c0_seq1/g.48243  ORF comp75126_c0_seq1/g.48243 comp75126_c0_seq1/m.48243 type:complete len:196 (-) comp75126_c0_seq1:247-834(-)